MIPFRLTFESDLTTEEVLSRLEQITDSTHYSWYNIWHWFAGDPKAPHVFEGSVDRQRNSFCLRHFCFGSDKIRTIYSGHIESEGGKTRVRMLVRPSVFGLFVLAAISILVICSVISPKNPKMRYLIILPIVVCGVVTVSALMIRRRAKQGFGELFSSRWDRTAPPIN